MLVFFPLLTSEGRVEFIHSYNSKNSYCINKAERAARDGDDIFRTTRCRNNEINCLASAAKSSRDDELGISYLTSSFWGKKFAKPVFTDEASEGAVRLYLTRSVEEDEVKNYIM